MKCPFCSAPDTQVIDSRVSEEGDVIRRRRRCTVCHKRCTTYETAELRMPQVVKTDNQREEYSRKKLETSFTRALHKRPVERDKVDAAIDRIEQGLLLGGERALKSRSIGEMVMLELKGLDQVGYIRFASVYKSFSDVEDFRDVIREVRKDAKTEAKLETKAEAKVEPKLETKPDIKPDPKNDPKAPFSLD